MFGRCVCVMGTIGRNSVESLIQDSCNEGRCFGSRFVRGWFQSHSWYRLVWLKRCLLLYNTPLTWFIVISLFFLLFCSSCCCFAVNPVWNDNTTFGAKKIFPSSSETSQKVYLSLYRMVWGVGFIWGMFGGWNLLWKRTTITAAIVSIVYNLHRSVWRLFLNSHTNTTRRITYRRDHFLLRWRIMELTFSTAFALVRII